MKWTAGCWNNKGYKIKPACFRIGRCMLKKRLIAGVVACLMAVSAFSMSASAYAWTDTIRVYKNQGAYYETNEITAYTVCVDFTGFM